MTSFFFRPRGEFYGSEEVEAHGFSKTSGGD